jgi:hypothetical protein
LDKVSEYFDFYAALEYVRGGLVGNTVNGHPVPPREAEAYANHLDSIEHRLRHLEAILTDLKAKREEGRPAWEWCGLGPNTAGGQGVE